MSRMWEIITGTKEAGERCLRCKQPYEYIWWAPSETWEEVTKMASGGGGLFCIPCFDKMAEEQGILLQWSVKKYKGKL